MAGFNHTLSAILRGHWLIDKQWANAHLPLVINMIKGNGFANSFAVERTGAGQFEKPFVVDPNGENHELFYQTYEGIKWNTSFPKNSVGILPVSGPITKYRGECNEPGSLDHAFFLNKFGSLPDINSVVVILDTPGGEARAYHDPVTAIKALGKPVLSYVSSMAASLGMWYASASKETYLSNENDQVGSIGSYCMLVDFYGMLENEGIKVHEIYAPQSTDKNKTYRDALNGDYSGIEKELKRTVDSFIQFVANRGSKAAQHQKEWQSGKMFFADEAVKYGLADGVMSLDKVISKASWLGRRSK